MIFHICPPEIKFVQFCLERFEQVKSGFNRCIIIANRDNLNPIHNIDNGLFDYIGPLNNSVIKTINNSSCHAVIIHTLNDDFIEIALNLRKNIPIIWRSWGSELHDVIYPDFQPLLPQTQKLMNNRNIITNSAINLVRPVGDYFSGKTIALRKRLVKKIEFLLRVDFIATVTHTEYNLLLAYVPLIKAEYIKLNYRSLDIKNIITLTGKEDSDGVMVGHSSYPYHNHADVFFQLNNDSGVISRIVVPLSYGNAIYRDKVIVLGKNFFHSRAQFLTDFMPFDDYLRKIGSCYAFVLNSKVQSGGANIIYSLLHGSTVYLREENPIFIDFVNIGIILFSIQKMLTNEHLNEFRLSTSDKQKNRQILEYLFNPEREKENVLNVYKKLSIIV